MLPVKNPTFVFVPAVLYLLLGWSVELGLRGFQTGEYFRWFDGLIGLAHNPLSMLIVLALLGVT